VIGASLLWVGWFGFNGGSALSAGGTAAMAMVVTQIAAAAGALAWMAAERIARGKASVLGAASGAVAGLVGITPAAGFVDVGGALAIGVICGVVCFLAATSLKRMLKADDSLDAFGLHGVGGILGALLTGVFVSTAITGKDPAEVPTMMAQMWIQLEGVLATVAYSAIMTFIILKVIDLVMGLRVTEEEEREGLDVSQHGERIE
ncbi:MAG: ammonia channel protein, partial [Moraxellaceae bacterium]